MITKTFQIGDRLVNVNITRGFWRWFQRTTVCTHRDPELGMIEDTSWGLVVPNFKVSSVDTKDVDWNPWAKR